MNNMQKLEGSVNYQESFEPFDLTIKIDTVDKMCFIAWLFRASTNSQIKMMDDDFSERPHPVDTVNLYELLRRTARKQGIDI